MNDETKSIDETALEEERPVKRRGRKPKNAMAAEETTAAMKKGKTSTMITC